jgi:multiple sugar transport system ATP-binding protein
MAQIVFENITKKFDKVTAVDNLNLTIEDHGFLSLVGPSGCGKTTTLNLLAGLETPTSGNIYVDGKLINPVPPGNRDMAMVFQSYALYPHMTAFENMAFALKIRRVPKNEIKRLVEEAADLLSIRDLLDRKPSQISGGQRQRVALGRALVRNPKAFLLDEPLSNLDAILRIQMRAELRMLFSQLHATVIYVTHDQAEAMTMSDRLAVFNNGLVQQVGTPMEIFEHPTNTFVAGFIGSPPMNFFTCTFEIAGETLNIKGAGMDIKMSSRNVHLSGSNELIVGVRPEDFSIEAKNNEIGGLGQVKIVENLGSEKLIHVHLDNKAIIIKGNWEENIVSGDVIRIAPKIEKIHFFDPSSKTNINR